MAFGIQVHCDSCNYSVKKITVGDGKHLVFLCGNCHRLVNPERIPYRLDCPACTNCHQTLERSKMIDAGKIPAAWSSHPPVISEISCPQCEAGQLSFALNMHMRMRPNFKPPEVGQRVHARYDEKGRPAAVGIRQQVTIQQLPAEPDESKVLDCIVIAADSKHVEIQCIGTVELTDLPGYA